MATTYEGFTGRVVGITMGTALLSVGIVVFVLVGVPNDLFPPMLERPLLATAPWLGNVGNDLSTPAILFVSLFCVMILLMGLWLVGEALFKSDYSYTIKYIGKGGPD